MRNLATEPTAVPIWRMVAGAAAGYMTCALLVLFSTIAVGASLGPDGVFEPGTYRSRPSIELLNIGLGVIAAAIGGAVAWSMGRRIGVAILAVALLVGGGISGARTLGAQAARTEPYEPRPEGTWAQLMDQAIANTQQDAFYLMGMPVAGAVGVLMGAGLASRLRRPAPQA